MDFTIMDFTSTIRLLALLDFMTTTIPSRLYFLLGTLTIALFRILPIIQLPQQITITALLSHITILRVVQQQQQLPEQEYPTIKQRPSLQVRIQPIKLYITYLYLMHVWTVTITTKLWRRYYIVWFPSLLIWLLLFLYCLAVNLLVFTFCILHVSFTTLTWRHSFFQVDNNKRREVKRSNLLFLKALKSCT